MADTPLGVLVCLASAAALMMPAQPLALAGACLAYVLHFAIDDYRFPFIHVFVDFVFSAGILVTLLVSFDRDPRRWGEAFVRKAALPGIACAGILFFAAGFSKLNWDFLDPRLSCASALYSHQISVAPYSWVMPDNDFGRWCAIFGTYVLELAAPLLWLHPRTRRVGFLLGFAMLFMLATNPVARLYVFAGPFLVMLALGFDWSTLVSWFSRIPTPVHRVLQGLVLIAVVLGMTVGEGDYTAQRHLVARIVVVGVLVVYGAASIRAPVLTGLAPDFRTLVLQPMWALALFLFCFETLPYFGLRNPRNMTMAANFLVSEHYSNHVIVTSALPLPGDRSTWASWVDARPGVRKPVRANCGKRRFGESAEQAKRRWKVINANEPL